MSSLAYNSLFGIFSNILTNRIHKSTRKVVFIGAAAAAMSTLATSASWAQSCGIPVNVPVNNINVFGINLGTLSFPFGPAISGGIAVTNSLISSITAANTAFLTQSTAFVSAPPDPAPDSQGGGIWVRGAGGDLNLKTSSTANVVATGTTSPLVTFSPINVSGNCTSTFHQDFSGVQLGQDFSRLNLLGWNIHFGTTAGYLQTQGHSGNDPVAGTTSLSTQAPFIGTYVAATNGGFFIDGIIRYNDYETNISNPALGFFDQKLGAHGITIAGSTGYNWHVPNSAWFVEPSAGIVWSHVSVDPLNVVGAPNPVAGLLVPAGATIPGTLQINDITSTIGRAGVRFGTTIESGSIVWQPFAAVSVWHEFGNDVTANFVACPGCGAPVFSSISGTLSTQNIGTFGQYSLGVNGQIANTGWLGFARVDYRNGDRIEGWSGTGGIRYQFNPAERAAAAMPVKAPVYKAPVIGPYTWTGFYIGALGGADLGDSHMGFPAAGFAAGPRISGVLGGGQLGYNYQIGSWVLGVEADAAWNNASGSNACGPMTIGASLFNTTCRDEADWIATVTGRLGYAWGRALLYGKAGAAWTHEAFSVTCNFGPLNGSQPAGQNCVNPAGALLGQISASDNRVGWTVGYGIEFGLTRNWSAKAEMDYVDFGNKNLVASDGTVINAGIRVTQGKIGLNYRFDP
jgi:opacity protein-like surface antigen